MNNIENYGAQWGINIAGTGPTIFPLEYISVFSIESNLYIDHNGGTANERYPYKYSNKSFYIYAYSNGNSCYISIGI